MVMLFRHGRCQEILAFTNSSSTDGIYTAIARLRMADGKCDFASVHQAARATRLFR